MNVKHSTTIPIGSAPVLLPSYCILAFQSSAQGLRQPEQGMKQFAVQPELDKVMDHFLGDIGGRPSSSRKQAGSN
jgi:hypothetical protein